MNFVSCYPLWNTLLSWNKPAEMRVYPHLLSHPRGLGRCKVAEGDARARGFCSRNALKSASAGDRAVALPPSRSSHALSYICSICCRTDRKQRQEPQRRTFGVGAGTLSPASAALFPAVSSAVTADDVTAAHTTHMSHTCKSASMCLHAAVWDGGTCSFRCTSHACS